MSNLESGVDTVGEHLTQELREGAVWYKKKNGEPWCIEFLHLTSADDGGEMRIGNDQMTITISVKNFLSAFVSSVLQAESLPEERCPAASGNTASLRVAAPSETVRAGVHMTLRSPGPTLVGSPHGNGDHHEGKERDPKYRGVFSMAIWRDKIPQSSGRARNEGSWHGGRFKRERGEQGRPWVIVDIDPPGDDKNPVTVTIERTNRTERTKIGVDVFLAQCVFTGQDLDVFMRTHRQGQRHRR